MTKQSIRMHLVYTITYFLFEMCYTNNWLSSVYLFSDMNAFINEMFVAILYLLPLLLTCSTIQLAIDIMEWYTIINYIVFSTARGVYNLQWQGSVKGLQSYNNRLKSYRLFIFYSSWNWFSVEINCVLKLITPTLRRYRLATLHKLFEQDHM